MRTDAFLSTQQNVLKEHGEEVLKTGQTVIKDGASKLKDKVVEKAGFDLGKFMKAFKDEVQKDIQKIKNSNGR